MWWSAHRLRSLSAFCLALLVYSAIPHFHADSGSLPSSRQTFGGGFDVSVFAGNRLPVEDVQAVYAAASNIRITPSPIWRPASILSGLVD